MARVFNFSAGPAVLPEPVLQQAAAEMLDWHGSGMSVMEMSHRGKEFIEIHANAEADLRDLMGIPKNYKVLFLQGGASAQFAVVPMNLLRGKTKADYVNTGQWSKKAISLPTALSFLTKSSRSPDLKHFKNTSPTKFRKSIASKASRSPTSTSRSSSARCSAR